ncbi:hypothetical protein ACX80E_01730 [Arthrobacter sp. TMN-49]
MHNFVINADDATATVVLQTRQSAEHSNAGADCTNGTFDYVMQRVDGKWLIAQVNSLDTGGIPAAC